MAWNSLPAAMATVPVLPDLLGQIPADEPIGTVTGDGAYDTRRCHTAIIELEAVPIIPLRKNGRLWKDDRPTAHARNETLHAQPVLRSGLLNALDGKPRPQPY